MTSAPSKTPIPALTIFDKNDRGLRVDFLSVGDCFAHRVVAVARDGQSMNLIESVEGNFHLSWPQSPILQSLNSCCDSEEVSAAMLIGAAGAGHWSLTVERSEIPCGLMFDVACRVKSLPPSLSSTYKIADRVKVEQTHNSLELGTFLGDCVLRPIAAEEPGVPQPCRMEVDTNLVRFNCETDFSDSPPQTLRWRYGLFLVPR